MMQDLLRGLVLILVFTGVCPEALESCKQKQLIQCTDQMKLFADNKDLAFFTDKKDLDKLCPELMEGLACIENYTQRCMKTLQRDSFRKLYAGTHSVITHLCTNETYKRDFLRHQPCMAEVRKNHEGCAKDYLERIQSAGRVGEGGLGASVVSGTSDRGEDADRAGNEVPKKTMTPEESQEYMRTICCSFQGYLQCSKETVMETCGSDAAKFTEEYLDQMALPLIESHCKDHHVGSDKCADLLKDSSASSTSPSPLLLMLLPPLLALIALLSRPLDPST
ncbi:uncharacterized protein [Hetaerina americana]|uniref:uncharacterized protein n=1 Tax=Hetaerina americana TaxID=62018 RepID=UPI003A7F2F39